MFPIAGMPEPLPLEHPLVQRLSSSVELRLQAISFFLLALLVCTVVVRGLWNYVQRDLTVLPRLSFGKAFAGVVLWGLLFFIVLTMISGARELMTPGAWKKDGLTYKLDTAPAASADDPAQIRRQHLEKLRLALWQFAATHQGRFPAESERSEISDELWLVPEGGGLRYHYISGLTANKALDLLVFEPELEPDRRLAILTNGEIVTKSNAEIEAQSKPRSKP